MVEDAQVYPLQNIFTFKYNVDMAHDQGVAGLFKTLIDFIHMLFQLR